MYGLHNLIVFVQNISVHVQHVMYALEDRRSPNLGSLIGRHDDQVNLVLVGKSLP